MDDNWLSPYFSEFEKLGESVVRATIGGWETYDMQRALAAREWCRLKEEERFDLASSKRDAREEATLAIAKSANCIASDAKEWTRWAAIAAIVAAVAAIAATIIAAIAVMK